MVIISLNRDAEVFIGDERVDADQLEPRLAALAAEDPTRIVYGFFGSVSVVARDFGRSSGTPTVKSGAVTIKMTNSTSITSTIHRSLRHGLGHHAQLRGDRPIAVANKASAIPGSREQAARSERRGGAEGRKKRARRKS
jgi:hypothetical protein